MSVASLFGLTEKPAASDHGDVGTTPEGLTLQDLLLLKVPVSWQEAVAVALEILQGSGATTTFPSPSVVTLSPLGELHRAQGRALPGHPVVAAAGFFKALMQGGTMPPELRKVIDTNLTPPPAHDSIEAFAAALAYFERPNRRADVAAVYTRGHALYVKATADHELEKLRSKVGRDTGPAMPRRAGVADFMRGRIGEVAAMAGLCAVIGISGYTLVSMALGPASVLEADAGGAVTLQPQATATTPSEKLSTALSSAGNQIRELVATGLSMSGIRVQSSAPVATTGSVPDLPSGAQSRTSGRRAGSPASPEWTVSVRDVTASYLASSSNSTADASTSPVATDVAEPVEAAGTPIGETRVFSSTNGEVNPATLIRPQLPSQARDVVRAKDDIGILELVINERGTVERARLATASNRLNDKMLVAAAKAWVFDPARLNGQPVRYRLRVQITE